MNLKQKISTTGYRLLYVWQFLMQGPASRGEILKFISSHGGLSCIGQDTLRLDLNTLASVGFDIKTKYIDGEYKYVLNWNPISISLTQSETKALNGLKRALLEVCDWRYIVCLYEAFQKITKCFSDEVCASELLNFGYFLSVDLGLLKALNLHCQEKNEIEFLYNSPNSESAGEKQYRVSCIDIEYDHKTKKLYLWCKTSVYDELSYFRVDKIEKILGVCSEKTIELPQFKKCRYKVWQGEGFQLSGTEQIVAIGKDFIEIEAQVLSEFHFVQKILALGESCFWVEDEILRGKVLKKLLAVREIYEGVLL